MGGRVSNIPTTSIPVIGCNGSSTPQKFEELKATLIKNILSSLLCDT